MRPKKYILPFQTMGPEIILAVMLPLSATIGSTDKNDHDSDDSDDDTLSELKERKKKRKENKKRR